MSCGCGKEEGCGGDGGCSVPQTVFLQDETGEQHAFYIADRVTVNNQVYAFLISTVNDEQYALLRSMHDENGAEILSPIVDEAEWAMLEASLFQ